MVKFYKGEVSARDIVEIAKSKDLRTAVTPFGKTPTRYAGDAVPWKHVKKRDGESLDEYIDRVAGLTKKGTFNGLKNAQRLVGDVLSPDKGKPANKGVCLVRRYDTGEYEIVPKTAAKLLVAAKKGEIVQTAARVTPSMLRITIGQYA